MTNNINHQDAAGRTGGLVWNADLTLQDFNDAALHRAKAIAEAARNRPKTALLEKEIMTAVISLYIIILGGFAALHLYASYFAVTGAEETAAAAQTTPAEVKAGGGDAK